MGSKQNCFKSPVIAGLFVFLALLCLANCTANRIGSKTVVQVNKETMTARELSEKLARRLKGFDALTAKDPANISRAKEEIIRQFVLEQLVREFAEQNKIAVSEDELEKEINSIRAGYPDDLSFRRMLAQENFSFTEWKDNIRQTLLGTSVFKFIGAKLAKPTEEEIKKYYEEHKERYRRKERVYLRQIVVDDLTKAQTIKEELRKADFSSLAKKYSVSPEAKESGLVGWVEKGSVDIFDKAFLLPVGGISQVLESSYGYHLFKVERKAPPGVASLEEVKDQIIKALVAKREQAEFMGWLDQQIRQAKVFKDSELIQSISVETRGKQ